MRRVDVPLLVSIVAAAVAIPTAVVMVARAPRPGTASDPWRAAVELATTECARRGLALAGMAFGFDDARAEPTRWQAFCVGAPAPRAASPRAPRTRT